MIVYVRLIFGSVMLTCKAVGVITVGQQAHLDIHTLFEQHIYTSDTSFDTRTVAIVQHGDVISKPMYQPYLVGRKRRTR